MWGMVKQTYYCWRPEYGGLKYPTIAFIWQRDWQRVIPFFAFSAEVRKIIDTTDVAESLNMSLRKALKTRVGLPVGRGAYRSAPAR